MRDATRTCGAQHMTARLRRVLVRAPRAEDLASWRELGWRGEPDFAGLLAEHDAFCTLLADAGADVVAADSDPRNLDAVYTFDPVLVTEQGALLLLPGKARRRSEPAALAPELEAAGVPVIGRLQEGEHAEGGDMLWLDERTLLVGRSYRTNDAGIDAVRRALPGIDVLAFDLPHLRGSGAVLHLLSLVSPVADNLAVAYLPLLPARLVELLVERDVGLVEVPDEEFDTLGPNVLALAPSVAVALDVNRETRRRLTRAGVEVLACSGRELSKGDGGPTCLTLPLLRG